jgi:O-acetyl-ADP-ribose deacetylase (regulator of RNase III)
MGTKPPGTPTISETASQSYSAVTKQQLSPPAAAKIDGNVFNTPGRPGANGPADSQQQRDSAKPRLSRTLDGARDRNRVPSTFHPKFFPTHLPPPSAANSDAAMRHRLNCEYAAFIAHEQHMRQFYTNPPPPLPPNIIEVIGDIFLEAPDSMALGHSVAEDFEMSAGIAVEFKSKFGKVDLLLSMGRTVGQVAVLPVAQQDGSVRYVFYIITKKRSRGTRPTLSDFSAAVHDLADACTMLGVKQLALPRIGTMKDRLQWYDVRRIISQAFEGRETEVYVFRRDKKRTTPPLSQLVDFIDPLLPKTPPSNHPLPDANRTPPFSTPDSVTPPTTTPAPGEPRSCPLPNEGVHSAAPVGPCAPKVVSDKREDLGRASRLDVDNKKTLTTAQGPDRSVHNLSTPATHRLINDLQKSTTRRKRRSSIPRPVTPTPLSNKKTKTIDISKSPDVCVNSDSQSQGQPPDEEEAGRRPAASLSQSSSDSQPANPQAGVAQNPSRHVNQNHGRGPMTYGGRRPHKHLITSHGNLSQKNSLTQTVYTQK